MRIVIPLFPGFTALDVVGPYEVLKFVARDEMILATAEPGPVRDSDGTLALIADRALADIDTCDVLVVPGGRGVDAMLADEAFLGWIRRMSAVARWTTSVCSGSVLLAAAGLLTGRPATSHWGRAAKLESFGAVYTPQRVVEDGTIMTSAGVSAGIDMALLLAERLTDRLTAEAIQLAIEYDPQPPYDSGSPAKASQEVKDRLGAGLR